MGGVIGGLFLAWVLSWFNLDKVIINGINELFAMEISKAGYYVIFAILGFLGDTFSHKK